MGYHGARGCFSLSSFPICGTAAPGGTASPATCAGSAAGLLPGPPRVVEAGSGAKVSACWDDAMSAVAVETTWPVSSAGGLPWVAVAFRPTAECRMTPSGGGNTDTFLAVPSADGAVRAMAGPMEPAVQTMIGSSVQQYVTALQLSALSVASYNATSATLSLRIHRSFPAGPSSFPKPFYMMHAVGRSADFGLSHRSADCFELVGVASCTGSGPLPPQSLQNPEHPEDDATPTAVVALAATVAVMGVLLAASLVTIFVLLRRNWALTADMSSGPRRAPVRDSLPARLEKELAVV